LNTQALARSQPVLIYRQLEALTQMAMHVLGRLWVIRLPPVKEELTRQIFFTGASATAGIVMRGAFIGTLIIAYVIDVLEADAALAVKILLLVVLREMGPLLAAVLVIQRSGTAIATELALMNISGEITSLRRMRIDPLDFLVIPRVVGVALSLAVLTFYVQVIAVGGGMLLSALVTDATYEQLALNFFQLANSRDIIYSVIKSLLFGIAIGIVSCYHGLNPPGNSINAVPKAAISAVMESTLLVMLLNAIFAYLAFGLLFFGLIRAQV
jgi:phospholipid/cholesterol/gamma-HCH transport system permease protein